jgi:predicted negative regulator of RcsB-dependent stress response
MAVPSHRKVSRKALKEPDEFVTTLDWIGDWVAANLPRVIIGAVALVAAISIVLVFSLYSEHRSRIASERFYRALNFLSDKDYQAAAKGFSSLAQDYSSDTIGRLAKLYLASTYLAQNQPARARDAIRSYLAVGADPLFRQMALMQLGVTDEDLGNYRDAYSSYVKAAQLNGAEKARAQISAARTLALAGDRRGAITAYQRFLRENPFSQQQAEVIEALAQMGAPPEPSANVISPPGAKGITHSVGGH